MTTKQLQLIHQAARQVHLIEGKDDARYRLLLLNVAGVRSARALNNAQFEDVMAVMESMGYSREREQHLREAGFVASGGSALRVQSTYWQRKVAERGTAANARIVFKICELIQSPNQRYEFPGLCERTIGRRVVEPSKLTPAEAFKMIEAMKGIIERTQRVNGTEVANAQGLFGTASGK
jgi:hypothetical protein